MPSSFTTDGKRAMKTSQHAGGLKWMKERLEAEPSYVQKSMFGCVACYLRGRLVLVLAARAEEPWQGILIPTVREFHEELARLHAGLVRHSVLGKWLYLPRSSEDFEETARALAERIVAGDTRIGVPAVGERKSRGAKSRRGG